MPELPKKRRRLVQIKRAAIEIAFIVFLFYANLLMGDFTSSRHIKSLEFALMDIVTPTNFCIALFPPSSAISSSSTCGKNCDSPGRAALSGAFLVGQFESFEGGEGFVGEVPALEDFEDDAEGESSPYQQAYDPGRFFFVGRLFNPLAFEVFAGEVLLADVFVGGVEGPGDEFAVDSLAGEVLLDAALAEFVVVLPQSRIGRGECRVVEIALLLEAGYYGLYPGRTAFAFFDAGPHEALEFDDGPHAAAEDLHRVLIEPGFVERLLLFQRSHCDGLSKCAPVRWREEMQVLRLRAFGAPLRMTSCSL
jgi:hypothetical protein